MDTDSNDIQKLVLASSYPVLFHGHINHWAAKDWTPENLANRANVATLPLYFRAGNEIKDTVEPSTKKAKGHPTGPHVFRFTHISRV